MKLTFRMTADDYVLGWKYKNKKTKYSNTFAIFLTLILIFAIALLSFMKIVNGGIFIVGVILLFPFFNILMTNKLRKTEFQESPVLNGENTIKTYDGGIEIITSFEKIFVPWQSLYAAKETKENLIILPTYSNGVYVINKQKYESVNLVEITLKIKENFSHFDDKEARK